jgi:hypothetical protein
MRPCLAPLLLLTVLAQSGAGATAGQTGTNVTMLRCVYGQHRVLHADCEAGRLPMYSGERNITECNGRMPRDPNRCGHRWRGAFWETHVDPAVFAGIPEIHFVGDSTLMRTFMHAINASDAEYTQKVKELSADSLNSTIWSDGRSIPVSFHRSLHVALAAPILRNVINASLPRALIVLAYGPHDTSWLVFRRAMPYFNRKNNGRWTAAEHYWQKFSTNLIASVLEGVAMRVPSKRPVIVLREQFFANCKHPKYSKYPLITRCPDLLNPRVIPSYRRWLQGLFGEFNVPTVGMDRMFPPCLMIDAGHMNRPCKGFEAQFLIQAYWEVVRSGALQSELTSESVRRRLSSLMRNQSELRIRAQLFTEPLTTPLPPSSILIASWSRPEDTVAADSMNQPPFVAAPPTSTTQLQTQANSTSPDLSPPAIRGSLKRSGDGFELIAVGVLFAAFAGAIFTFSIRSA